MKVRHTRNKSTEIGWQKLALRVLSALTCRRDALSSLLANRGDALEHLDFAIKESREMKMQTAWNAPLDIRR